MREKSRTTHQEAGGVRYNTLLLKVTRTLYRIVAVRMSRWEAASRGKPREGEHEATRVLHSPVGYEHQASGSPVQASRAMLVAPKAGNSSSSLPQNCDNYNLDCGACTGLRVLLTQASPPPNHAASNFIEEPIDGMQNAPLIERQIRLWNIYHRLYQKPPLHHHLASTFNERRVARCFALKPRVGGYTLKPRVGGYIPHRHNASKSTD